MTPFGLSWPGSALVLLGLALVFVGERAIGTGGARVAVTALGLGLIAVAVAARIIRLLRATGERKAVERLLLVLYVLGAAGVLLYFLQGELGAALTGGALSSRAPRLAVVLQALFPALLAASVIPLVLVELSYATMARAPVIEAGRVRDAASTGLGLAAALVFAFSAVFVATARDVKWDLSYFRTARPGEATRNIVRGLDAPLRVSLFFPPANEVREQVADYFGDLARESPQLVLESYDQAIDVARARELGVTGNGTVVIHRDGGRKELLSMALELERARSQLRNLDQDAQKRLLMVARGRKAIYLTAGHGERSEVKVDATDQRAGISMLRRAFEVQNLEVKPLGVAEGLASEVPGDAAAVLVLGPTERFAAEEIAALRRYFERGGRLLVALDPEARADHGPLVAPFGFRFQAVTLANDEAHVRRSHQLSDRSLIGTATYASHASISTLARYGNRAPMVFINAGYLEELSPPLADVATDVTVRAHPRTWNDRDGNFEFNPPAEERQAFTLAAVATRKVGQATDDKNQGRAILVADSDAFTDLVLESFPGNAYFAADGLRWLVGEEHLAGETVTEEDTPVEHTRRQDMVWFYSSVFLMPALVLGAGLLVTRNRGRRARQPVAAPQKEGKRS